MNSDRETHEKKGDESENSRSEERDLRAEFEASVDEIVKSLRSGAEGGKRKHPRSGAAMRAKEYQRDQKKLALLENHLKITEDLIKQEKEHKLNLASAEGEKKSVPTEDVPTILSSAQIRFMPPRGEKSSGRTDEGVASRHEESQAKATMKEEEEGEEVHNQPKGKGH